MAEPQLNEKAIAAVKGLSPQVKKDIVTISTAMGGKVAEVAQGLEGHVLHVAGGQTVHPHQQDKLRADIAKGATSKDPKVREAFVDLAVRGGMKKDDVEALMTDPAKNAAALHKAAMDGINRDARLHVTEVRPAAPFEMDAIAKDRVALDAHLAREKAKASIAK